MSWFLRYDDDNYDDDDDDYDMDIVFVLFVHSLCMFFFLNIRYVLQVR